MVKRIAFLLSVPLCCDSVSFSFCTLTGKEFSCCTESKQIIPLFYISLQISIDFVSIVLVVNFRFSASAPFHSQTLSCEEKKKLFKSILFPSDLDKALP